MYNNKFPTAINSTTGNSQNIKFIRPSIKNIKHTKIKKPHYLFKEMGQTNQI